MVMMIQRVMSLRLEQFSKAEVREEDLEITIEVMEVRRRAGQPTAALGSLTVAPTWMKNDDTERRKRPASEPS